MISRSVNLLVSLIASGSQKCPPGPCFPVSEEELITLAQRNKALPYLLHFTTCPKCRNEISNSFSNYLKKNEVSLLFMPEIFQREKKKLGQFCQQQGIKVVLIKDFSPYAKLISSRQNYNGSDIDILIKKEDFNKILPFFKKNNYKFQKELVLKDKRGQIFYRESHFLKSQTPIVLDIHTQIAIPHVDSSPILTVEEIGRTTEEIIKSARLDKTTGLYRPNNEDFLLSLVVHYLGSDILKGLRSLADIVLFAQEYEKQINWQNFWLAVKKLKITYLTGFIFLLGSRVFSLPKTAGFNDYGPPKRVKFLARYWPTDKIALFPPIERWDNKNEEVKKMNNEVFFLKLLLQEKVSPFRLLRPKIFLFLINLLTVKIKDAGYTKPFDINLREADK